MDQADQARYLGRSTTEHDHRLVDLERVFDEVRRPAAQPEPDGHRDPGPASRPGEFLIVQMRATTGGQVKDRVKARADLGQRSAPFRVVIG